MFDLRSGADAFPAVLVITALVLGLLLVVGLVWLLQRFVVRNSWGTDWGQNGYFTMPYAYLADRNLSDDFWTVRK